MAAFAACTLATAGACAVAGGVALAASAAHRGASTFRSQRDFRSAGKWGAFAAGTAADFALNRFGGAAVRQRITFRDLGGTIHYNARLSISRARFACRSCYTRVRGIVARRALRQSAAFGLGWLPY